MLKIDHGGSKLVLEDIVHIIPVGFEEDRAVFGLMELGATRIYLLIDEKQDSWGEEARRHAERVKDRLKHVMFNQDNLRQVPFDPTSYQSSEKTVTELLRLEKDAKRIYLNISSSTKLCAVAFALTSAEFENAFLYYVVPEDYNLPSEGRPFSSGARRIEVWSPRRLKFGDWEKTILRTLDSKTFSSLGQLNQVVIPEDISKASKAKLSYYVRKLKKEGLVEFSPGKKIAISALGKSKLYSPTDDAKRLISTNNKRTK